jgi:hypothetical protein
MYDDAMLFLIPQLHTWWHRLHSFCDFLILVSRGRGVDLRDLLQASRQARNKADHRVLCELRRGAVRGLGGRDRSLERTRDVVRRQRQRGLERVALGVEHPCNENVSALRLEQRA